MRVRLADFGDVFATRDRAAAIRSGLHCASSHGEPIELDLADVRAVSWSFADELVGRLMVGDDGAACDLVVTNATPEVGRIVSRSIERRTATCC